jgi:hypothetical protein
VIDSVELVMCLKRFSQAEQSGILWFEISESSEAFQSGRNMILSGCADESFVHSPCEVVVRLDNSLIGVHVT